MGGFTKKIDQKSSRGKVVILLFSLRVFVPLVYPTVNQNTYASLEKVEEVCIGCQRSGDFHESWLERDAWQAYGYEVGQGSCSYFTPSLNRWFPEQMNGKELVLSRCCFNDKTSNTIEGKRNQMMGNGEWIDREDEGAYELVKTFKY